MVVVVAEAMWWWWLRRLCGGGGLQVHNHATSWPNLQEGSCKNSSRAEFQVEPECGNNHFWTPGE